MSRWTGYRTAANAQVPPRPTTPPPPPPPPPVSSPEAHAVADLALRKAQAFDDLAGWLAGQVGVEYTTAVDPAWLERLLRVRAESVLDDGRSFRAGKSKPWLRRGGW